MNDDRMQQFREALAAVRDRLIQERVIEDQEDWCEKAGFAEGTLRHFLSGKSKKGLSILNYAALADAAGLPISVLVGEDAPLNELERLILEAFRSADEEGKRALLTDARREKELQTLRASRQEPPESA